MGEADLEAAHTDWPAASGRGWWVVALRIWLVIACLVWTADIVAATYWPLLALWLMVAMLVCLAVMCWLLRYTDREAESRRLALYTAVICLVLAAALVVFDATVASIWFS